MALRRAFRLAVKRRLFHHFMDLARRVGPRLMDAQPVGALDRFRYALGIDFYNVPYKNNLQTLAATASGEVQGTLFALGGATGQAKAGKVKILAAISEQRLSAMPGLPTIREEGVDLVIRNWVGTFARAGTPREIVKRMSDEVGRIIHSDETRARLDTLGTFPGGGSPEEFDAFVVAETAKWAKVIKEAGVKPD